MFVLLFVALTDDRNGNGLAAWPLTSLKIIFIREWPHKSFDVLTGHFLLVMFPSRDFNVLLSHFMWRSPPMKL
jgi:hypothetical protein